MFIGGGPPVYAAYAPFIRHWDINRLPHNGEADRWFDPAWLVASGASANRDGLTERWSLFRALE